MNPMQFTLRPLVVLCAMTFALPACDKSGADETEESEDDDSSSKKKKKKRKKKRKKKGDDDDAGKSTAVPGIDGFVVPAGGKHKRQSLNLGERSLAFEGYTYPTKDFPRENLHADFKKLLTKAGWTVAKPDGGTKYVVTRDAVEVDVLFGEAGESETKINVMEPRETKSGSGESGAGSSGIPECDAYFALIAKCPESTKKAMKKAETALRDAIKKTPAGRSAFANSCKQSADALKNICK